MSRANWLSSSPDDRSRRKSSRSRIAQFGATTITLGQALAWPCRAACCCFLRVAGRSSLWRSASARTFAAVEAAEHARETGSRMAGILQAQAEMQGRMSAVGDVLSARQAELNQSIGQRLDAMTGRIGQTMAEQTRSTHENLAKLQERLAVIDYGAEQHPVAGRPGRATSGDPLEQADARRLRSVTHGGDRRRRPAAGRLCLSGNAVQRQPGRTAR